MAIACAETQGVIQQIGYSAHSKLNQRSLLLDVLRHNHSFEPLVAEFVHRYGALRPERILVHGTGVEIEGIFHIGVVDMRHDIVRNLTLEFLALHDFHHQF